jgi:hypothetical protein
MALWSSCSPRGSVTSKNPPGVKLYPPCLRPLATRHHLQRGTCSHFESPLLPDPTTTKHCFVVALSSMAATMTTMSRSGNDATLHGNNATLGARSATTTARSGDDGNLGDNATPLGARSVTTLPSLEMLSGNTKLGDNFTLGDDATARRQRHASWQQHQARRRNPTTSRLATTVGNSTNSMRTTDRPLGVARVVRCSKPLVKRRGRE